MKKILFVAYGGGHINIIDLIAKNIIQDTTLRFKILALTTAYNKVIDKYPIGIVKKISDYKHLFKNDINDIINYGEELLSNTYNQDIDISKEDLVFYLGISMFELVNTYGIEKARALYKEKKRNAFLPVNIMQKILLFENIDIVVSTTAPRFEQASFIAANNLNIKTVEILDLFGDLYPLPEANNIVIMNEDVKSRLIERDVINKKYFIFGQPSIEETVSKIKLINIKSIKKKINIQNNKPFILLATQQLVQYNLDFSKGKSIDNKKVYYPLLKALSGMHDKYNILLRIHPNEDINTYNNLLSKYPNITYVNNLMNTIESISVSDIIVTHSSTLAIEAIASGKIVYTFKHDYDIMYPIPTMMKTPFIYSSSLNELIYKLKNKLNNMNLKVNTKTNFFPKDSVLKIINLLKELK